MKVRFGVATRRVRFGAVLVGVFLGVGATITSAQAFGPSTPGLPAAVHQAKWGDPLLPLSGDPLLPFYSDSGLISLSVDAIGTNYPTGAVVKVHKNAGATVRKAFLFAASTGFTGYTPVDGDVTLNGTPITWDPTNTITNDIASVNVESDVTSVVQPIVDAAPAGDVSITAAEPNVPSDIEGEILAVILDDPTVTTSGSVTLLYGAQQTAGDTFHVALAAPIDKSAASFELNLSLGISFGYQPAGQFSTVDVNGTEMTSSAGGQDDCVEKYAATPNFASGCNDGMLITAGGIGDSNDNPPDATADDETCTAPAPPPRCDDELYNLLPFVNNGDTSLTFTTTNPSADDNIFFGALDVHSGAAVVGEGVVLSPTSATNDVGQTHTLTATVQDDNGAPIQGVTVHFQVTSGPNAGINGNADTGSDGKATFSYTSSTTGTDHIVASFTDAQGGSHTSNEVTKTWSLGSATVDSITATCAGDVLHADATASGAIGSQFDLTLYQKTGSADYSSTGQSATVTLTSSSATHYTHDFDVSALTADSYKVVSSTGTESNVVLGSTCGPGGEIPEAPAALLLPLSLLGLLGIALGALYVRRRSPN
jgi:hypothetical protein